MADKNDDADRIAETIETTLAHLQLSGLPSDLILGTAMATVFGITAATFGNDIAAQAARRAAERLESAPHPGDARLINMQPQGRC